MTAITSDLNSVPTLQRGLSNPIASLYAVVCATFCALSYAGGFGPRSTTIPSSVVSLGSSVSSSMTSSFSSTSAISSTYTVTQISQVPTFPASVVNLLPSATSSATFSIPLPMIGVAFLIAVIVGVVVGVTGYCRKNEEENIEPSREGYQEIQADQINPENDPPVEGLDNVAADSGPSNVVVPQVGYVAGGSGAGYDRV